MIKIDKNIPLPVSLIDNEIQVALSKMEPGNSFHVKYPSIKQSAFVANIRSNIRKFRFKNAGKNFITRTDEQGVRVWRTE